MVQLPDAKNFQGLELRDPLLTARQSTHGSFEDNAFLSQSIKRILHDHLGWGGLTDVEREVMDMIALKFSRILSGKSLEKQHWEDVVGYGRLALEQCTVVTEYNVTEYKPGEVAYVK